jgi:AcrR family transcriptional regulator
VTRAYRLRQRAEAQAATRARIVAAARDLYLRRGMASTSMSAIARAADVAPNTVRHHFPTMEDLARAVGASVLDGLDLPEPAALEGDPSLAGRLEHLAVALADLSQRGQAWWDLMQREPALGAIWQPLEEAFEVRLRALVAAALGPLADDPEAAAVVTTVIGPPAFYGLQQRGLSAADATRIGLELAVPWLERRSTARSHRPSSPEPPGG